MPQKEACRHRWWEQNIDPNAKQRTELAAVMLLAHSLWVLGDPSPSVTKRLFQNRISFSKKSGIRMM